MTADDTNQLVRACFALVVNAEILPEWEFQTLTGFHRCEVAACKESWDLASSTNEQLEMAMSVVANLIGYPGVRDARISQETGFTKTDLATCLELLQKEELQRLNAQG